MSWAYDPGGRTGRHDARVDPACGEALASVPAALPEGHDLDPAFVEGAVVTHDQAAALEGADFIYVKNWSASQPYGQVTCTDTHWMLTPEKLNNAPNAKVMHCLPVRRNVELSGAVLDSPQSIVIQQAGNRVWAAQAVLESMLL